MRVFAPVDAELAARALKPRDAWWTVLVIDPVALRALPLLLRSPTVTPLRLTGLAAVLGAGAVTAFLTGHLVLGAVLFELRFFVDCLDGKVARVRGAVSPRGAFVDVCTDVVLVTAALVGLGWHLAHRHGVPVELPGAVAFFALVLFWLILYDSTHPAPADPAPAAPPGRLDGWFVRHRLERLPRTVEVETAVLFLAPLTGSTTVLVVAMVGALAYYVIACVHLPVVLFRRLPDAAAPGGVPRPVEGR